MEATRILTNTPYDRVAYPSALFQQTHPERMHVLARLFGLGAPDLATARILDIGGGDGVTLTAYCAAHPGAEGHNFDLSEEAIGRGRALAEAAGVGNVTMTVEDITRAHERYAARSFDFVIAHGVYAWVPDHVRQATMALIGQVLADNGVAFVSFNAMPGGYIRLIMRDMLLHVLDDVNDPAARLNDARIFLAGFGEPQEEDDPLLVALRKHARSMLQRPDGVLFHDELGPCYFPQTLTKVAEHAAAEGLRFLTDGGRNRHLDGFLRDDVRDEDDPEADVIRQAQMSDYATVRFFRQALLVRAEQRPLRDADPDRLSPLLISSAMVVQPDGALVHGEDKIVVPDTALGARLADLSRAAPQRVPVTEVAPTREERGTVLQLFNEWHARLHAEPEPFALEPGERPCTSALVRAQLALGDRVVCTLDHRLMEITQEDLRALLMAADGTRTVEQIAEELGEAFPGDQIRPALRAAAAKGLLAA